MIGSGRTENHGARPTGVPRPGPTAADQARAAVTPLTPEVRREALRAIGEIVERRGAVGAAEIDLVAARMSTHAAAGLRAMYEAMVRLDAQGAPASAAKVETVSLAVAGDCAARALPPALERKVRTAAGLEIWRLFADPVKDAQLHEGIGDLLTKRLDVRARALLEAEPKPELTLREENTRKTGAALALLADRRLPRPLAKGLLERLGAIAQEDAIPLIEAAGKLHHLRTVAEATITQVQRGAHLTVVLAAMEVKPYCGTGGLSNVMGELARALAAMGHRVIVLAPAHECIDSRRLSATNKGGLIHGPDGSEPFRLWADHADGVDYYFIDSRRYFSKGRPGIYGANGHDYGDNAQRYDYFGAAIPVAIRAVLGTENPDVVQLNDAHTASAAVYLGLDPSFEQTKTVFAVHNLGGAYQGKFNANVLPNLRLDAQELFWPTGPLEFYGDLNLAKLGLTKSDATITVSREYKKEIVTKRGGEGLHGVLRALDAQGRLWGNLNGIDPKIWDPATDPLISHHFSAQDPSGKAACKADLQRLFGLPARADTPLVGILSRLTDQKGFDDILPAIEGMMIERQDVQFVVCGDGDPALRRRIDELAARYPNNVAIAERFSTEVEHKIYAGSDLFLMPSRFEPCGLPQMYALRYLTIPIVRGVGGLEESIRDYDSTTGEGNGFKFKTDLQAALQRALSWYRGGPEARAQLLDNAARCDFSWESSSAVEQVAYYRKVLAD